MPCQSQNYKKHAIAPNNNSINWRNLDYFVRLRRLITRFLPYDFNLETANYMKHNFEMAKRWQGTGTCHALSKHGIVRELLFSNSESSILIASDWFSTNLPILTFCARTIGMSNSILTYSFVKYSVYSKPANLVTKKSSSIVVHTQLSGISKGRFS